MKTDLYNAVAIAELLFDSNKTATAYSNYIDLQGYEEVTFIVRQSLNTADATNYFTPAILVAEGTPGTIASYAAAESDDVTGSLTVHTSAGDKSPEVTTYRPAPGKRYACIRFAETLTADGDFTVYALVSKGRHKPISGDSLTTGTVT